jgi:hypothetical protein
MFLACCLILIICVLHLPPNPAQAGWIGAAIGVGIILSLYGAVVSFARFAIILSQRGRMSTIAESVTTLRTTIAAFTPSTVPISELATALMGLSDARTVHLDRMESKLDDARDVPWQRGMALLREVTVIPGQSRQRLASAAESFEEAHDMYGLEAAYSFWAALIVAAIYGKLGNRRKARYFAEQSYGEAVEAVQGELSEANRVSARRRKTATMVVRALGLVAGAAAAGQVTGLANRAGAVPFTDGFLAFGVLVAAGVLLGFLGTPSEWLAEFALGNLQNNRFANARDLALIVNDIQQIAVTLGVDQSALRPYELQTGESEYRMSYVAADGASSADHPVIDPVLRKLPPDLAEEIAAAKEKDRSASALAKIAKMDSATDPHGAARLADKAERTALSITDNYRRASALIHIAEAIGAMDPHRTARLADEVERIAHRSTAWWSSYARQENVELLAGVAKAVVAIDPDRAARLVSDAERIARSIISKRRKTIALKYIDKAVVATDLDRAADNE